MLVKTGGHITTTTSSVPLPPRPSAPSINRQTNTAAVTKGLGAPEKPKKVEAKKRRAAADVSGDDIEPTSDDPAAQEHALQQSTSTSPTTSTRAPENKKPPL